MIRYKCRAVYENRTYGSTGGAIKIDSIPLPYLYKFREEMVDLIKKIIKEIQKLEQQKQLKIEKRNQLDKEINIMNLRLKDLNNLKNQYEKLEKNTDSFFENIKNGDEI